MNTVMTWQQDSQSLGETETIAFDIGQRLQGGEVIELISDLGGGKTAFTRGLAKGMGSQDTVASPSFTISKEYAAPDKNLTMHHYDFYRLETAGIMAQELHEVMNDPLNIVVIEWGDIVADIGPADRLTITITKSSELARHLQFSAAGPKSIKLKGIVW